MKKVLGWAVVAMLVGMGVYFAGVGLGVSTSYLFGVAITITLIGAVMDGRGLLFGASFSLGASFVVAFGFTGDVLPLVALLAFFLIVVVTFVVAMRNRIGFGWALIVYLIEGVGLYGTLASGAWWPAAVALILLGVSWLVAGLFEKMNPAVSI